MSKIYKIIEKWKQKIPPEENKEKVFNVLERNGFILEKKKGSHVIARHEKLKGQVGFGLNGEITIPVKNGKKVKGHYIKNVLKAIDLVKLGD